MLSCNIFSTNKTILGELKYLFLNDMSCNTNIPSCQLYSETTKGIDNELQIKRQ